MWSAPTSEVEAMHIATSGNAWARARMGWRAGIALAMDTKDTQQVFYLAFALDRETLPRIAQRLADHPSGRQLLRDRPAIDTRSVDLAWLRTLPEDTLGGAYVRSLDRQGLDPDIFQPPPGLPEDLTYVAQRVRQTHDLWHVLTGLSTDIPGEVALQAFTDSQLGLKLSLAIVLFGQLFFGLRYPRMWRMVARARKAGKAADFLLGVRWEEFWTRPLSQVREQFGIADLTAAA
jgi:ubiquinone biosynthesis protein COQ4